MSTAAILFLRKLPCFHPSIPRYLPTLFSSSLYRLLSTAVTTQAPPPNPYFAVVDYLIQSCGLPSDGAIRASKLIQHLQSPDKPDAVLCFLRKIGVSESGIRTAVSREPRILVSDVEKNWRPNVAKLQEIGLSIEDISGIISHCPKLFQFNITPKIDFWMRALGSLENMSVLLKRVPTLINSSLEKVIVPNLSFLQNQCGLSVCQIVQLIKSGSRLIKSRPEAMKIMVKRAEELGVSCSSQMFVYALSTVASVNKNTLDSRVHYLKRMGFSQEEVAIVISKVPTLVNRTEELLGRKMDFLMEQAGCGMIDVVHNPTLLTYSIEKRLIPRSVVRKMLISKGLPVANKAFASFIQPSEKDFLEKFVIPYERDIPRLGQAYADACSGKIEEDVAHVIAKAPTALLLSEELLGRKMEFLLNESGCGKMDVVCNPILLTYNMEKQLIPRSVVRKLLMSKGLPVANKAFVSFIKPSEKDFLEKFVLPFEHDIPGLGQAFVGCFCWKKLGLISSSRVSQIESFVG